MSANARLATPKYLTLMENTYTKCELKKIKALHFGFVIS